MNSRVVIDFIAKTGLFRQGTQAVVGQLDSVERATKRVRQALFVGGSAIGGALGAAGVKAASFERDMRNVNSIVQDSDKVFSRTSAGVLDLATQIPRSANELAQGAYQIVSAGFTQPQLMTDILAQSGKAASAGLTTVNTSALAVVTAMNAYGAAAGNATRVSDLLFQTVNVGQVSFEQLATNLGDFIGIAAAGGGTLAETLSAYASITIATGQASRSATSLQGIYRQLIKPGEALNTALQNIGATSGKQAVQMYGLQGTLDKLSQSVNGDTAALAQMFQDVEGLNGVLALTGPNAEKARASLAQFTDEGKISGATQRALAEQSKSFNHQFDQMKSSIGAVVIEFGQRLVPFMKMGVSALQLLVDGLNAIPGPVQSVLAGIAALAAVMGTVGFSALMWARTLRTVHAGMVLIQGTQVATAIMAYARSSVIASAASALLARTTTMSGASLLGLAKGAGVAVAALLAVPAVAKMITNTLIPQNVDAMTKALLKAGDAGDTTGTRLEQKFGAGLEGLASDIHNFTTANDGFWEKLKPKGLDFSIRRVDELDKAMAKMVQSGNVNRARQMFEHFEKGLRAQGFTTAQINQAFNDYLKSIGDVELQNRAASDGQHKMANATESVGEAMKKAEEDAKAYQETLEQLSEGAREFTSISNITGKVEDKHRSAYDAAQKQAQALERQRQRAKEVASAQNDMAKAQDKVNQITAQAPIPGTKGWHDLRDAQREVAEAADKVRGSQEKVNAEYKKTGPTIGELTKTYQEQINAYTSFQENLRAAAGRGVPMEVVRELQTMGEEGVQIAALLAKASPKEFDKLRGVLAEKVRLEGEAYQKELDKQLVMAAAIAKKGAGSTVDAIIEEMKRIAPGIEALAPDVAEALKKLGIVPISEGVGLNVGAAGLLKPGDKPAGPPPPPPPGQGPAGPRRQGRISPMGGRRYLADNGATIRPGLNVIENRSALPEYVVTAAQMQGLVRANGSQGSVGGNTTTTTINHRYQFGDIYAQDLDGAMRQADQKRRLGALAG